MGFVDQSTAGPGQVPPEGSGFIAGSPLAPNTPYDLLSSAPLVPGIAAVAQLNSEATYRFRSLEASATFGAESVNGSVTNAAYWNESLLPTLDPHVGSHALPYRVTYPTHAGADDAHVTRLSPLCGRVATNDGNLVLRGGWFDLAQTDRFVFTQPALVNVNPAIAYAPAETLSPGLPGSDTWAPARTALPLHGLDIVAKRGIATLEVTDAALPALAGDSARLTLGSLVVDHGDGTRFSAEALHLNTGGAPFSVTVPFGAMPRFVVTPQGVLPTSFLSGQQETVAGLRAAFHVPSFVGLDGVLELGRAWYDAAPVVRPGTQGTGGYERAELAAHRGRATASLDWFRMEPRYATAILPYGVPENQWSAAFAWPGQWLKSTYQLIDNSALGVNRQGYRLRYFLDGGPLELRAEYTDLRQVEPETRVTATQAGFVDGFYLPQLPTAATLGRQKRYGLWSAWHAGFGDVWIDIVDDTLYRPFFALHPLDRVSYEVPQAMLTVAPHLSKALHAAVGYGRYAAKGTFAEPIDFAQRLFFAGLQVQETPREALLVTYRRTTFSGITTDPESPLSPNFTGSGLIVEQRLRF
ncbi:MAG: hypothetical protein JO060_04770 [Candidatus Eremiobacteraeota bacterium]|nr:hypothetical protein [Candidatus Eremiobacteraeota bacterium]MBV9647409.1 hypothetical protein [Candidatus Eremiobacteraeota bacterium]